MGSSQKCPVLAPLVALQLFVLLSGSQVLKATFLCIKDKAVWLLAVVLL